MFCHLGHFFVCLSVLASVTLRGGALGVHQVGATHLDVLWCCMWGRGPRGNKCCLLCSLLVFSHFPHYPQSNLGPSGADFQVGGFVYILGPCVFLQ